MWPSAPCPQYLVQGLVGLGAAEGEGGFLPELLSELLLLHLRGSMEEVLRLQWLAVGQDTGVGGRPGVRVAYLELLTLAPEDADLIGL